MATAESFNDLGTDASRDEKHVKGADDDLILETDDADNAASYGDDDAASDTTSVASSLIRGHIENGRRYSTLRDDYWGPSDEKQFETMDANHFTHLIMRSEEDNLLFASPVPNPRHILDIGTGSGTWAMDVADKYPDTTVHGIDLFPPPNTWVPPNCVLEVGDIGQEWTWKQNFDLIHIRYMNGAFTDEEWAALYERAYNALGPGGWIEQLEPDCPIMSDDGSLDPSSYLAGLGQTFFDCAEKMGRSVKVIDECKKSIEAAGFINVQEVYSKLPIGTWPKNRRLKEAGRIQLTAWTGGLEGFLMFLLTKFGSPQPWTQEEVLAYTAKLRKEFNHPKNHIYHYTRRVWAQKPMTP